jgi:hypothetical protein
VEGNLYFLFFTFLHIQGEMRRPKLYGTKKKLYFEHKYLKPSFRILNTEKNETDQVTAVMYYVRGSIMHVEGKHNTFERPFSDYSG